jgi:hypothetical protein
VIGRGAFLSFCLSCKFEIFQALSFLTNLCTQYENTVGIWERGSLKMKEREYATEGFLG